MIDVLGLVNDVKQNIGMWCGVTEDTADLARVADSAISSGIGMIALTPNAVSVMWPWLEGHWIKIMPRFYVGANRTLSDAQMSDLVININSVFKQGATGALVFVNVSQVNAFADMLGMVRDDLFFNKDMGIGLDINEIGAYDWKNVFGAILRLRTDMITFALTCDKGDKSDFVGRVYAMLNAFPNDYKGEVCWMVGTNAGRMEQVIRLTEALRPDLLSRTRLLICE